MIPSRRGYHQAAGPVHFSLRREPIGELVTGHEAATFSDQVGRFRDHFVTLRDCVQSVDSSRGQIQSIWIRNTSGIASVAAHACHSNKVSHGMGILAASTDVDNPHLPLVRSRNCPNDATLTMSVQCQVRTRRQDGTTMLAPLDQTIGILRDPIEKGGATSWEKSSPFAAGDSAGVICKRWVLHRGPYIYMNANALLCDSAVVG